MQVVRRTLSVFLMLWLAAPHLSAQQAPQAPGREQVVIDRALEARASQIEADTAAVARVLARDEVAQVAERMGVDIHRVQSSIALLDAAELAQVADQARAVEDTLAGGATTIVITTTTIIIALLVVIIIVLLAD
jgi:hypothetical protein